MPTLLDGTVIDENFSAVHFFTPQECQQFYGRPRKVNYITIHHWGVYGQNFDDVVRFLCSERPANPTSAHAVIQGGRAASIVSPDNAAFHAGSSVGNAESIGLECHPEATDEDYVTVAAYIVYLRGIYGNVPLRRHSDWFATACPGNWDIGRLDKMANDMAAGNITVQEEEELDAEAKAWIKETRDRVIGRGVQRYYDPNTLEVRTEPFKGAIAARSTDVHDIISTNKLVIDSFNKLLEAVKAVPGLDPSVVETLSTEFKENLKEITSNLSVTLEAKKSV